MKQVICDRCEAVVPEKDEEKVRDVALLNQDGNGSIENLGELCPACIKSLRAWRNPPRAVEGGPPIPRRRALKGT